MRATQKAARHAEKERKKEEARNEKKKRKNEQKNEKEEKKKHKKKEEEKSQRDEKSEEKVLDSEENDHGMSDHRDTMTVQLRTGTNHAHVHGIARKQRRRHQPLKSLQGLPQREVRPKKGKDEAGFLRHQDPFSSPLCQTLSWPGDAKESDPGPPAARYT